MSMIERPLDSDTLGKKGERRFGEICDDAKLIANFADHDRAGWDYIVDFRLPSGTRGLDARPAPITARIQVKTQWDDRDEVKLRLSAAEQLVKHNGPSFICVLSVTNDLQFSRMRLIHCRGEIVERVLKRLREAEATDRPPNGVWLRIRPSKYADALDPTHIALRGALEKVCTTDHLEYLRVKDAELKTLGFDENFMELNVGFSGPEDAVVDAFLGLGSLAADSLAATQTRFGIMLPMHDFPSGPATMTFEPTPDRCRLIFRAESKTYKFAGRLYRLPGMIATSVARPKVRIVTDLLNLTMVTTRREDDIQMKFTFNVNPTIADARRKPREWSDLYAVLCSFSVDGIEMEIRYERKPPFKQFMKFDQPVSEVQWTQFARLTEAAAHVFDRAGAPNAKISLDELWAAGKEISTLNSMICRPDTVTGLTFVTDAKVELPRSEPLAMTLAHSFKVGDYTIAYAAGVEVSGQDDGEKVNWSSGSPDLLGVKRVRTQREFDVFLAGASRQPYRVVTGTFQTPKPTISRRKENPLTSHTRLSS